MSGSSRNRKRRRRPRALFFGLLLALAILPEVAVLEDFALAAAGWPATLLLLVLLQIPIALELTGRGRDDQPRGLSLVLWHVFYAFWTGAFLYAFVAGWARLGIWAVLGFEAAAATPPLWVAAVPFAIGLWGVVVGQRRYPRRLVRLPLEGLPAAWEGLRIVQLSDLHVGRFIGQRRLRALVARAEAARPDIVFVTGDIVDSSASFARQAAEALGAIRAPLGVWAVLGNHDHYAGAARVRAELERAGVRVLFNDGRLLERGGSPLWLCGVDDLWHGGDLEAALAAAPPRAPVILLSHQPNLFPAAAERGVALTLAGHTHGGQVALPFFRQVSLARLISPFVSGVYVQGGSVLYVNRGAGVVRPLLRIGAPPEVAVLALERAPLAAETAPAELAEFPV